uniref:Tetraspanin 31 n=1 Tax=Pygocentrus nattereri TaxID=42514 RepID=A0AAR2JVR7_PYGNA
MYCGNCALSCSKVTALFSSCICISNVNVSVFQENVLCSSWETMDGDARKTLEQHMDCCGLINILLMSVFKACKVKGICFKCGDLLLQDGGEALKILGGVGLFFSFSELLGVWLVLRYRKQKDPQTSPDAF